MAKESVKTKLDRFYDLHDEAAGMGRTIEEHVKMLEVQVAYDRERELKFHSARAKLRDGYSEQIDLDNVDVEKIREDLGIPRGHEGVVVIKSEVKKLLTLRKQE
jgi:hypothetical protein